MSDKKVTGTMGHIITDSSERWFIGQETYLHREDGPAVIRKDGSLEWFIHGERHREDGPAVIFASGFTAWWYEGRRHRIGGPAISHEDGRQTWYVHGRRHRTDGPAELSIDDANAWWLNGYRIFSADEFKKLAGLTDEEMTMLILKYGEIK